jgi:hypothetical protein
MDILSDASQVQKVIATERRTYRDSEVGIFEETHYVVAVLRPDQIDLIAEAVMRLLKTSGEA